MWWHTDKIQVTIFITLDMKCVPLDLQI